METDRLSVLIVDDNQSNLFLLDLILKKLHANAIQAKSGEEALELLSNHSVDLVFMDLQMPGLSGLDTTKKIRTLHEPLCDVPVVAVSAELEPQTIAQCKEVEICECIEKPVNEKIIREILEMVRRIPGNKQTFQQEDSSSQKTTDQPLSWERIYLLKQDLEEDFNDLYSQMFAHYMNSFPTELSELNNHIAKGEVEEARKVMHKLRGASLNLGFKVVVDCCIEIKNQITGQADSEKLQDMLDLLECVSQSLSDYSIYFKKELQKNQDVIEILKERHPLLKLL